MTNTPVSHDQIASPVTKCQFSDHQAAPAQQQLAPQPQQEKGRTGFAQKTLWDWLNLFGVLLIPIVIAAASIGFSVQQSTTSLQLSDKQHQSDQNIASDQQRATTLKAYMDDITELLLHEGLRESKEDSSVRVITRAKTLVTLKQLDGERKAALIQFLYEAQLIGYTHSDNENKGVTSIGSILNLTSADLTWADLTWATLSGAKLSGTFLNSANLNSASLDRADLNGATLTNADLSEANLGGASVTPEQLARCHSLKGATLPNGSSYPSLSYPIPRYQEPTT
jgi:hypothetical protein